MYFDWTQVELKKKEIKCEQEIYQLACMKKLRLKLAYYFAFTLQLLVETSKFWSHPVRVVGASSEGGVRIAGNTTVSSFEASHLVTSRSSLLWWRGHQWTDSWLFSWLVLFEAGFGRDRVGKFLVKGRMGHLRNIVLR